MVSLTLRLLAYADLLDVADSKIRSYWFLSNLTPSELIDFDSIDLIL